MKGCYRIWEDITAGIKKLNSQKHKVGGQRTARKDVAKERTELMTPDVFVLRGVLWFYVRILGMKLSRRKIRQLLNPGKTESYTGKEMLS